MTKQPTPLPRVLDDEWEPPPRPPRRVGLIVACIGTAVALASAAFFKSSASTSPPDDARIFGPIATPYEDHVAVLADSVPHAEAARPAPRPRAAAAPATPRRPGYLSVNSRPWAELSVDGQVVGNTPQVRVSVIPGRHHLLLARPGFLAHSAWVDVPSGATVRLTNITLAEITQ